MTDSNAGWEVEGFIERLTRRDDKNSERLVLEAISHLRAFSRDCDALRESNREAAAENERLRDAAERVCWFDWSSNNDADAVKAVDDLRAAITAGERGA